jgi:hypothetical protein
MRVWTCAPLGQGVEVLSGGGVGGTQNEPVAALDRFDHGAQAHPVQRPGHVMTRLGPECLVGVGVEGQRNHRPVSTDGDHRRPVLLDVHRVMLSADQPRGQAR